MPQTSYVQSSFLGGEWAPSAQGRYDRPDYRISMAACVNAMPLENGAWDRRPGFQYAGITRNGYAAVLRKFDFDATNPYNLEFTTGYLRFWVGATRAVTNDFQRVRSISNSNPCLVQMLTVHGWTSGDQIFFSGLEQTRRGVQGRVFTITVIDTLTFSLSDPITGTAFDGTGLDQQTIPTAATCFRVLEIPAPWVGSDIQNIRCIQAETQSIVLCRNYKPYTLQSTVGTGTFATFALSAISFKDGPYLDPPTNGALITPSGQSGVITVTLSFSAWSSSKAYQIGDYVTYSSVSYKSKVDANVNHQPDVSTTQWEAVNSGLAVGPNGFTISDIGRHIRLYSEPQIWAVGTTYAATDCVAYNGVYWTSLAGGNIGIQPGSNGSKWQLNPNGATWTWGRITALTNSIAASGGTAFSNMLSTPGVGNPLGGTGNANTAVDGLTSKTEGNGLVALNLNNGIVGLDFGGSPKAIAVGSIYPSTDHGFGAYYHIPPGGSDVYDGNISTIAINLRGSNSGIPTFDGSGNYITNPGTLLGTTGFIPNTRAPISIASSDTVTTWQYVWFEITSSGSFSVHTLDCAQIALSSPSATVTGTQASMEILGDNLLYGLDVRTWRLGLYSDTSGWPTCGTYHEGRLWLSGAVGNRIDGSVSNDIFNFAPTDATGVVSDANAVDYTFNAPDVNTIYWMQSEETGIVCGTLAGEWLVRATQNNNPITPTSAQAKRVSEEGCANIEPRKAGGTLLIVERHARKLFEFFADAYSGRASTQNLTSQVGHITAPGIAELAYQSEKTPVVWVRGVDGSLSGITYRRERLLAAQEPTFAGWHRHTLGSGRTVESMVAGVSPGALETLTVVTSDGTTRHIEILQDLPDDNSTLADAWYLDNSVVPTWWQVTSTGIAVYGLYHLDGSTVSVFAGGLDCGDVSVSGGTATVPFSGAFTQSFIETLGSEFSVLVGFTYTSQGQLLRPNIPAEAGSQAGPGFAKSKRSHMFGVQLWQSAGISFGTSFTSLLPFYGKAANGVSMAQGSTYSGMAWDVLRDSYSFDSQVCWQISRPLPTKLLAIGAFIATQDR